MKIEIDIDPYELVKYMKSTASINSILNELNPDEADILDYMPIEQLVQLAYDEDPGQVKENLNKIIGKEIQPYPNGLLQLSTFIRIAFKENDTHEFMKTIKSALRNEVTILYEVK